MSNFDIWNELGNIYLKVGAFDEAIEAYKKAIKLDHGFGWPYSNLALAYTRTGKFLEAISLYQKSIELFENDKDKAVSWNRLGDAYRQLNEYESAAGAYEMADKLNPENASATVEAVMEDVANSDSQAVNETGISDTAASATHLSKIHKIDLKNAHVLNELGNIYFKAGNFEEAIEAYNKAIELDHEFGWPYSNLALAHAHQENFAQAVLLYKKSIELLINNKDKAVTWNRLGDAYRQLNEYKSAIAAYEIADKLSQDEAVSQSAFREINIEQVFPHPRQTRVLGSLEELADSIRKHGVIQPLIVFQDKDEPGKYMLISGRRRLEAARQVGLKEVPVIVRQASDQEVVELAVNENIHHVDLNPLEIAEAYQQLSDDFGLSAEEIAAGAGKSRFTVANTLRLLQLPEDVKQALICKRITEGHARALLTLASPELQSTALQYVLRNELSIRQTDDLMRRMTSNGKMINDPLPVNAPVTAPAEISEDTFVATAQKTDNHYPENTSLMTRARFILMSNPRVERKSHVAAYQHGGLNDRL